MPHDSGAKHVQGAAEYIDDIPEPAGTLHVAVGGSPVARGTIRRIDLSEVRNAPGVVAVITAADIPGKNDISPAHADEPVFAETASSSIGQPVFAVIATSRDAARRAVLRGRIEVDAETPNVSVEQGKASGERVLPDYAFVIGDAGKRIADHAASHCRKHSHIGGQEHFYLEGQVALAVPGEDDAVLVYSSTQHPSEVQHIVARVLAPAGLLRHLPRAPYGRRLWRQGNSSDAMGGDCGLGGAHHRPALQAPARPRRRYDDDRQTPRFPRRVRRRLRIRRAYPCRYPRS